MKIVPVSNNYHIANNSPLFKGLWGLTSSRLTDFDPVMGIPTKQETKYYYPFNDETEKEVNDIADSHKQAYIDESEESDKYIIKDCLVCATLPFNKAEFKKYQKGSKSSDFDQKNQRIHVHVRDKYLNYDYQQQRPAQNAFFEEEDKKLQKKKLDIKG